MPTSASQTFGAARIIPAMGGRDFITHAVVFGASLTLAKGTVVAQQTVDKKYYVYASGASDGTENARGILEYAIVTDASSKVTFGDSTGGGDLGQKYFDAPIITGGCIATADCVISGVGAGLTTAVVTALNGKLISGTAADGILEF